MTELTSAIQANYDVQFVIDAHAVVEYLVKYKTKPEKRSQTYKDMMKILAKATDATTQTMAGMCASLINVLSGNRDFGDVETCHQLNQSELMWWSRVFSQPFQMDGRQALAKAPEEGDEDAPSAPQATEQKKAFTKSKETWYVQRPEALEALSSYELLARFDDTGGKYMRLKFGPPKVPHYAPFKEQIHASVPQSGTVPPKELKSSKKDHEAYCEQRLVMFKPYRQRAELLGEHGTFAAAMAAWLSEPGTDRGKDTVRHEIQVVHQRRKLVEEYNLQFGEVDEFVDDAETDEEDNDDAADNSDPLVALFGARPVAGEAGGSDDARTAWDDNVHRASPLHDWSHSQFDLSALYVNEKDKEGWLVRQKGDLGDDAVASGLLDYSKYDKADLNVEQRFAYELITRHANETLLALHNKEPPPPALFLIVDGCGGTGKSYLLHCVARYIRERASALGLPDPLCISAQSGTAAEQIYGQTIHSLYAIDVNMPFSESVADKRRKGLENRLGKKWYHFVDERSLVSQTLMGQMIARVRVACPERKNLRFSGRSLILFGDDCQLPPTGGGRVFHVPPSANPTVTLATTQEVPPAPAPAPAGRGRGRGRGGGRGRRGGQVFPNNFRNEAYFFYKEEFTTVVQLLQNVRAKGSSPEQLKFRSFLLDCLRACSPQPRWYKYWKATNALSAFSPQAQIAFRNGFWFCARNKTCDKHNKAMLLGCGNPIVLVRATYPGGNEAAGRKGSQKDASGLLPELALCVGAMVIYKVNTWTSRAVVHGLLCKVIEIVYNPGEKPLHFAGEGTEAPLPLVVFVEAMGYKGPSFEHLDVSEKERRDLGYRGVFPVLPVERKWTAKRGGGREVEVTRRMLPIDLAWARSIHKSQGCTAGPDKSIPFYLLDLGDTEIGSGMSYVGGSRAMGPSIYAVADTENGFAFPSERRFNNIGADGTDKKKEVDLRLRQQETRRLVALAARTRDVHAQLFAECEAEVAALTAASVEGDVEMEDAEEPAASMTAGVVGRAVSVEADEAEDEDSWEEPVVVGEDSIEVSFDLKEGVQPEDLLFDGMFLHGESDDESDSCSVVSVVSSFATASDAHSDDDLECFCANMPRGAPTFIDTFSDVDLQMLLVAHIYNTTTEDGFIRAVAGLMGAAKLFRVQAELPHPNEMRAMCRGVEVSCEETVQVLGVDDAFSKELAAAVEELRWR